MKRLFLHIGLPKTGSSYIQAWLTLNRSALAEIGIWAPAKPIHAHRLAAEYITASVRSARSDVQRIKEIQLATAQTELENACRRPDLHAAIVSSEYFFECQPRQVEALREIVGNHPVTIVVFLRRQDRLVESGYNQEVKAMGISSLLAPPKYAERMNWLRLYESWAEVFGEENVRVINYDLVARSKTLLEAFCGAVEIPENFLASSNMNIANEQNESLPANFLEFKRLANMLGEFDLEKWLARAAAAGVPTPPFRLDPEVARAHLSLYAESNQKLAERLHMRDPEEMFPTTDLTNRSAAADFSGRLPMDTVVQLLSFLIRDTEAKHTEIVLRIEALEKKAVAAANVQSK